jgi:hypothetical protein
MAAKRKNAYFRATQEAQHSEAVTQPDSQTVAPSHGKAEKHEDRETVVPEQKTEVGKEKISFYLAPGQTDKLDDLAYKHKKRTGKRINRNDIVRHLIDQCTLESLDGLS